MNICNICLFSFYILQIYIANPGVGRHFSTSHTIYIMGMCPSTPNLKLNTESCCRDECRWSWWFSTLLKTCSNIYPQKAWVAHYFLNRSEKAQEASTLYNLVRSRQWKNCLCTSVCSHGLSCTNFSQSVSVVTLANLDLIDTLPCRWVFSRPLPVASLMAFADIVYVWILKTL